MPACKPTYTYVVIGSALALGCSKKPTAAPADDEVPQQTVASSQPAPRAPSPTVVQDRATPPPGVEMVGGQTLPSMAARQLVISYAGAEQAAPTVGRTKAEAQELANQVKKQITDRASFIRLAAEHSDAKVQPEGEVRNIPFARLHRAFGVGLENLKPGEASNVLETARGFHIVFRE